MKSKRENSKSLTSQMFMNVLVIIITISCLIIVAGAVSAADTIGSMTALEALGIDTSLLPDGYDPNSADNPYGRGMVTLNPVYELYITDTTSDDTELFGHNQGLEQTVSEFRSSEIDALPAIFNPNAVISVSESGNFIGESALGKKGQIVTVYSSDFDKNGGLYLYFNDPVTMETSDIRTLLSTDQIIGNSDGDVVEDFVKYPYLLKNYMQVATGDFDNNGIDEVAVYIAEEGNSRVEIYRLKVTYDMDDNAYLQQYNWEKAWTYYFNEGDYVSNMVSLIAGDFSRDGTEDLALTWGYYYGPDENQGCQAAVLFGQSGSMLQKKQTIDLTYDSEDIVRAAFTFGDINGDNVRELVLGGQLASDIEDGNLNTRFLASYNYVGESDSFEQGIAKNFDLFEEEANGSLKYPAMERANKKLYTLPAMVANITTVNLKGKEHPSSIYLDSILFEYGDTGLDVEKAFDWNPEFNEHVSDISDPLQYYVEYGVKADDYFGNGIDTLRTLQYSTNIATESPFGWLPYSDPFANNNDDCDLIAIYFDEESFDIRRKELDNGGTELRAGFKYSFCSANTDNDTSLTRYTGEHYYQYSDPKVLAVIASPPHFEDLDNDEFGSFYMVSETSYSKTTGSGSSSSDSFSISAGGYVGFSSDWKTGLFETEYSYKYDWTWETMNSEFLEQTVSYSTSAGEDSVAFYSIPVVTYTYEVLTPVIDDITGLVTGYDSSLMLQNFPKTPSVRVMPLDSYENIATDYPDLPNIAGNILTHNIGVPSTYPSTTNGYEDVISYNWKPAVVDYGNGSYTQEINMTDETNSSFTGTHAIEFKMGGGFGSDAARFYIGGLVGGAESTGTCDVTTNGNSFTGKLYNMPAEAEAYGYSYAWKLFSYTAMIDGDSFPVVNYVVTDVMAPPQLPMDFQQNSEGTTDNQIKLTWSYDRLAVGFQIYRYYDFPDGGGSYELAFIPASEVVSYDGATKYYEFVDTGLEKYEDYEYRIQVIGMSQPTRSILSKVHTAKTKTDEGYPDIELIGPVDEKVVVYPDTPVTVTALINNISDYNQTPRFQWQKLEDNGWNDIEGDISYTFTFDSAETADEGDYRCRVNAIYGEYYISAYSEVFTVEVSKRTPLFMDNSFRIIDTIVDGENVTEITVSMQSAHPDHYINPTGEVVFVLYGFNWPVFLHAELVPGEFGVSEAKYSWEGNQLPEGGYEIIAYYVGDNVYQSLTSETTIPYLSGSEDGYYLSMDSRYMYGDSIEPTLMNLTKTDGITYENPVSDSTEIVYEIYSYSWNTDGEVVSEYVETINDDNRIIDRTGYFVINAHLGYTVDSVSSKFILVYEKYIEISVIDQLEESNSGLNHPGNEILEISQGNLVNGDTLEDLGLVIRAFNTAGNEIEINSETPPGSYTIVATAGESSETIYNNYRIRFVPGTYIITGPQYSVSASTWPVNGKNVASIELISPEGNDNIGWTTQYSSSANLVFRVIPHNGYSVKKWYVGYEGGSTVEYVTNSEILSLVMLDQGLSVAVEMEITQNNLVYETTTGGVLSCTSDTVFASGSVASEGAEFTFLAQPLDGYHFKEWQLIELGKSAENFAGVLDGDGNNTCTITMGSADTTLYAIFERDDYILTLSDNLQASYLLDHDDDLTTAPVNTIVSSGVSIKGDTEITVTPIPGYVVQDGAIWYQDGSAATIGAGLDNQSFVFNIVDNTEITTTLVNLKHSVTVEITESVFGENSVDIKVNDISVTDTSEIAGASRVEITAMAGYGYEFSEWIVTGNAYTAENNILIIEALGEDTHIEAVFVEANQYQITLTYINRGSLSYTKNDGELINAEYGEIIGVYNGDSLLISAEPETNYMVENWRINGYLYQSHEKTWTLENIEESTSVVVTFAPKTYTTVTYSTFENEGSISATTDGVDFESGNQSVGNGSTVIFTAEPEPGRMIYYWEVNEELVTNELGVTLVDNIFIIDALAGTTDVVAYFTDLTTYDVNLTEDNVSVTAVYTPETPEARTGATVEFTVIADEGYRVTSDSSSITGNEGSISGFDSFEELNDNDGVFVINSISDNLVASFSAAELYSVTVIQSTGGEISSDKESALENEVVSLTAVPEEGMVFGYWIVEDETTDAVTVTSTSSEITTLTMPASDITVTAHYDELYDLNIEEVSGGNISTSKQTALSGDEITLTAISDSGKVFSGWTVEDELGNEIAVVDASSETTTMTMPAFDVYISAQFSSTFSGGGMMGGGMGSSDITLNKFIFKRDVEELMSQIEEEPETERTLEITSLANSLASEFSIRMYGESFILLYENDIDFRIRTWKLVYTLPDDLEPIMAAINELLDMGYEISDIEILVTMEELSGTEADDVLEKANTDGLDVLITPVQFKVEVTTGTLAGDKTIEIERFNNYSIRLIAVPNDVNPEDVTTFVVINGDGTYSHIPTVIVEMYGKAYFMIKSPTNSIYLGINSNIKVDGTDGHWSEDVVNDLASRMIISEPSNFEPDRIITRAEFSDYITKALGIYRTGVAENLFIDIGIDHEYADAITVASQFGIINGYPDGTFKPDNQISREEAMLMFARAMEAIGLEGIDNSRIENYTDKNLVSEWAYDGVEKTLSVGVFNGRTVDTIVPQGTFTHAEAIKAIHNLLTAAGLID